MKVCPSRNRALLVLPAVALLLVTLSGGAVGQKKPKKAPAVTPAAALVKAGKAVYGQIVCAACHSIAGKGGKGAPDLTTVGARRKADWLMNQIRDPKKNNPTSSMPAYDKDAISDKNLKALVAYLGSLRK